MTIYSLDVLLSYLKPVCFSMSSSNCCFLTCIQISQEAGQMVWYSHLFQNFPQFVVIHTVKGFGIVNKAEIDVFLELSYFFHDPVDLGNLISGSSAFSKPAWTSGSSRFTYCWSLAWRLLSITLLACGVVAERSYFTSEVRGGTREEQPHIQEAVAARAQEGREELLHVQSQEGRPCPR